MYISISPLLSPRLHIYINLNRYRCEYMKQMKLCLTIVIDPYNSILSAISTNLSRTGYIYKCIGVYVNTILQR